MGCADSKPVSHTKKQALKQQSIARKPTNLNSPAENPEIIKQTKSIQNSNPFQTLISEKNLKAPQTQPVKSTLQNLQNNPNLTKQQVNKSLPSLQQELKKQNIKLQQVLEKQNQNVPIPIKLIQQHTEKKNQKLSSILERREESEQTRKLLEDRFSSLKPEVQKQKQELSDSIGISNIPDMNQECLVSKITKNNLSSQKIQESSSPLKQQNQRNGEQNAITTEEININIVDDQIKINQSTLHSDEFAALAEEHFDLHCSFDPNTLVIDMNKVAW